jgi:hypothetical protein
VTEYGSRSFILFDCHCGYRDRCSSDNPNTQERFPVRMQDPFIHFIYLSDFFRRFGPNSPEFMSKKPIFWTVAMGSTCSTDSAMFAVLSRKRLT